MSPVPWDRIVNEAWARRQACPDLRACTAVRLINGADDGAPAGVAVDRYAEHFVIWARPAVNDATLHGVMEALRQVTSASPRARGAIVLKRLAVQVQDRTTHEIAGPAPRETSVLDDGVQLVTRLQAGLQTGLFIDARPERRWVRAHAAGYEILNLFAYTGAFTAHAVVGGARRVTSVDASRAALLWGRRNVEANGFDADAHRWFADDAESVLRRAPTASYGGIILDPPAFGRAKRKKFVLRSALPVLLDHALRAVRPQGWVLMSTHDPDLNLEQAWEAASRRSGRRADVAWTLRPDCDFPGLDRIRRDEVNVALQAVAIRVS